MTQRMRDPRFSTTLIGLLISGTVAASPAAAFDVGLDGKRLVVRVSLASGKVALKSVQKSAQTIGSGDPANVSGVFEVSYVGTANVGTFPMPAPWFFNTGLVTKYRNQDAPDGPSEVANATLKTAKSARVLAKGLGGLDITSPPGAGGILVVLSATNGDMGTTTRMCTLYSLASGSTIEHQVTGYATVLRATRGVATACPPP